MNPRHRDGFLASVVAFAILLLAWVEGVEAGDLLRPGPLLVGAAGALALELLMARFPDRSRRLWARPSVQLLSVVAVLGGGVLLARLAGAWVFTAVGGGLATYFVLLVFVLTDVVPGPETWFDAED